MTQHTIAAFLAYYEPHANHCTTCTATCTKPCPNSEKEPNPLNAYIFRHLPVPHFQRRKISFIACAQDKQTTISHSTASRTYMKPVTRWHSDKMGPINPQSMLGHRHFLTIFDVAIRYEIPISLTTRAKFRYVIFRSITTIE